MRTTSRGPCALLGKIFHDVKSESSPVLVWPWSLVLPLLLLLLFVRGLYRRSWKYHRSCVSIWSFVLNRQWLDNLFLFPEDNLERNSDLHEFGRKLLSVMKLGWQLLNRLRSRVALCCSSPGIVYRVREELTLKTKPLSSCLYFFLVKLLHSELLQFMMIPYSLNPCALQMTLSPLSRFWSVGHLEDLHGPSNSVFYQEELKQIKRSLSKPVKKSLT